LPFDAVRYFYTAGCASGSASVRLSTVDNQASAVAGPRVWNTLLQENNIALTFNLWPTSHKLALQKVMSRPHHFICQTV